MAAETEADAERLFAPRALWRLGRDRGVYTALPSPEDALAHAYTDMEKARVARMRERSIYGTPEQVGEMLRDLGAAHGVDEIALLTTLSELDARRRSYTLLAEEFGLAPEDVRRAAE